jgi:hypothetical protein
MPGSPGGFGHALWRVNVENVPGSILWDEGSKPHMPVREIRDSNCGRIVVSNLGKSQWASLAIRLVWAQ